MYRGSSATVMLTTKYALGQLRSRFGLYDKLLSLATLDTLFLKEQGRPYVVSMDEESFSYQVVNLGHAVIQGDLHRRKQHLAACPVELRTTELDDAARNWREYNGYTYWFDMVYCAEFNEEVYCGLIRQYANREHNNS